MRDVAEQRAEDRDGLVARLDADVHVHAPDHHVATPVLRAVDEAVVALLVRDLLVVPLAERMRAGAHEIGTERLGCSTHLVDELAHLGDGTADGVVHARDDLDGVEQQLRRDVRMVLLAGGAHGLQHLAAPRR